MQLSVTFIMFLSFHSFRTCTNSETGSLSAGSFNLSMAFGPCDGDVHTIMPKSQQSATSLCYRKSAAPISLLHYLAASKSLIPEPTYASVKR